MFPWAKVAKVEQVPSLPLLDALPNGQSMLGDTVVGTGLIGVDTHGLATL